MSGLTTEEVDYILGCIAECRLQMLEPEGIDKRWAQLSDRCAIKIKAMEEQPWTLNKPIYAGNYEVRQIIRLGGPFIKSGPLPCRVFSSFGIWQVDMFDKEPPQPLTNFPRGDWEWRKK